MFKTVACAAALVAGVALSSPASAQTFTPAPTSVEFSGPVALGVGVYIECNLRMTVDIDAFGDATVSGVNFEPGNVLCAYVVPYGTWTLEAGPGLSAVTFDFGFSLVPTCFGQVIVPFTGGTTATIDLSGVTLPGFCTVDGLLESDGPLDIF